MIFRKNYAKLFQEKCNKGEEKIVDSDLFLRLVRDVLVAKETFEEALPLFQENIDGSKELDERYHAIMSILESINENFQ